MTGALPPLPIGRQQELAVTEALAALAAEVAALREALPLVNHPDLRPQIDRLAGFAATATQVLATPTDPPGQRMVDELADLQGTIGLVRLPPRDPDLGPTLGLREVRGAQGQIVMSLANILAAAAAMGLHPSRPSVAETLAAEVPRALFAGKLAAVAGRLDAVVERLDALDAAGRAEPGVAQQAGLVSFYLGAMRVEASLARLSLTVGDTTVDFAGLARAAEAMAGLTGDFTATLRGWADRASAAVRAAAETLRPPVRRMVTGVRAVALVASGGVARTAGRLGGNRAETRQDPQPSVPEPPPAPPPLPRPAIVARPPPRIPVPETVEIPAGSFLMGVPEAESKREGTDDGDARPVHKVTIAHTFFLGKYPVTRGEYTAFAAETGRDDESWSRPRFPQNDRHPVVNVSVEDAEAYLAWLTDKTGQTWRLPSEAEWEYAARAGTSTARYWGDAAGDPGEHAHFSKSYGDAGGTAAVGGFDPNQFGLYDMLGNVWEWTADPWHGSYARAPANGSAWTTGGDARRVLRGGAWYGGARHVRSAYRLGRRPEDRRDDLGFRFARVQGLAK